MTEKEKAAAGLIYDANYDKELIEERLRAKDFCYRYNNLHPAKGEERRQLIGELLGKTGREFLIEQPFYCDYGYNIEIGENFYANYGLIVLDAAKVAFGSDVFIGPSCGFYTAGHPVNPHRRNQGMEYAKPITVGNSVWLGGHCVVLPGVAIGDNTVIGAGSVVTGDIPAGVIAVGSPCKVLRPLTEEELSGD